LKVGNTDSICVVLNILCYGDGRSEKDSQGADEFVVARVPPKTVDLHDL